MTPTQPLPLNDIIPPESISIWPLALGWWVLLSLIIVISIASALYWRRHQKKWGYRHQALQQLNRILHAKQENPQQMLDALHYLLKQTAITAYPNTRIAPLHQQQWRQFLNQHTLTPYFTDTLSHLFEQRYTATNGTTQHKKQQNKEQQQTTDIQQFAESCRPWIKQHHTQPQPCMTKDRGNTHYV